jgi:hypothetical protein
MQAQSPWTLDEHRATFDSHGWTGSLDLNHPASGLTLRLPNRTEVGAILPVEFSPPNAALLKECYVRQGDLIVAYPQRDTRPFMVQLDWRILQADRDQILLELWISVQTYLLDSNPVVKVGCQRISTDDHPPSALADEESLDDFLSGGLTHMSNSHLADDGSHLATVVWLLHPRDQLDTLWEFDQEHQRVQACLFDHFMEKGVIRRARMRCLVSQVPVSASAIQAAAQDFSDSPLPLTA